MAFFDQMGGMGGASPMLGGGGQSAGLMGAGGGMNPQLMQLLMAMQNRAQQGGQPGMGAPQLPGAPQAMGAPSAGMMPHIPPVPQQPGMMQQMQQAQGATPSPQQNPQALMAMLAQMNPQLLRQLLQGSGGGQ